jgi:hypothetical protein
MRKFDCFATMVGAVLLVGACSDSYKPTPSASGVFPAEGFTGRKVRVEISGEETKWAEGATVSFGDGITVSNVVVASESDLFADLDITTTAALADHDVTVTSGKETDTLKSAFRVTPPVEVSFGKAAQGSITQVTITNHDVDNPFDATQTGDGLFTPITFPNIQLTAGAGVNLQVSTVTPFAITAIALIDVDASASVTPQVVSGPTGGNQLTSVAAPVAITARTATALVDGTPATGMATAPYDAGLYSFTPTAFPGLLQLSLSTTGPSGGTQFAVLGASGHFTDLLAANKTNLSTLLRSGSVYVVTYDFSGDSAYSFQLGGKATTLSTTAADTEPGNSTAAGATTVVASTLVDNATLTDDTDQDWFKIVVPAGKKIHVITAPGDAGCDTLVDIYGPTSPTTQVIESSDADYHEDVTTDALTAGTYYIKISASQGGYFQATLNHYVAAVMLE